MAVVKKVATKMKVTEEALRDGWRKLVVATSRENRLKEENSLLGSKSTYVEENSSTMGETPTKKKEKPP